MKIVLVPDIGEEALVHAFKERFRVVRIRHLVGSGDHRERGMPPCGKIFLHPFLGLEQLRTKAHGGVFPPEAIGFILPVTAGDGFIMGQQIGQLRPRDNGMGDDGSKKPDKRNHDWRNFNGIPIIRGREDIAFDPRIV